MEKLLVTRKQAADMLSISVDTLDVIRKCGLIASVNIGSRVYFRPDDLVGYVARKAVKYSGGAK